jgi:choline dehydrogenase-like flavoprotein
MARVFDLNDDSVVVVIGSGAAGGTLSNELAQQGIDVVCLEAGKRLVASEFRNDATIMFPKFTWLDPREGSGELNKNFPAYICKTVGGSTTHWTALSLRMTEHEFYARNSYGDVPGTAIIDWPFTYEELSEYYNRAEDKMGVAGTHDMPRHPANNNFMLLNAGAMQLGYPNTETANLAINSIPRDGRPQCQQLGFCITGCVVTAKWSTLYTEIPKAEATDHFELRPESMVIQIEQGTDGRITGVVYEDGDGNIIQQKARAVAVAGNAIETARVLLNSRSPGSEDGLGNQNGLVGRYYMRHVFGRVVAHMPGKVNNYRGIIQAGSLDHESHHDTNRGFASGYHIETASVTPESLAKSLLPHEGWGDNLSRAMEAYENFSCAIICGEDFPIHSNQVSLHESRKDKYGLPITRVHYESDDNANAMREHAYNVTENIFGAVGAKKTYRTPMTSSTHNMGTARMAKSESDGVCDPNGKVWGIPNLYVSDGSLFPTAMTANPTLTIVALAIRQAQHIGQRMTARGL